MAAPVVGRMMADILPYLGVEPTYEEGDRAKQDVLMPDFSGLDYTAALDKAREAGLRFRTIGEGSLVSAQLPLPGLSIAAGSEVILYFEAEPSQELESIPELSGLSYEEARETLSRDGIYIKTSSLVTDAGQQRVSTQSVPAGARVGHGSVVEVTLISADETILGRY